MCLDIILSIFSEAITIIIGSIILFFVVIYLIGIIISLSIGAIVWFVLLLTNPLTWIFLIAFILGGCLLLNKRIK
ncbi:hypothetical protein DSECCO2_587110 [anaerobic digester metagenome]